jgi:CubicO group peptidase (beta-lactamase class C family)
MLVGIAHQEGLLNINDKSSKFLGNGWTSIPQAKEDLITIKNQLTMTTGLDDNVQPDNDCTSPACLQYKADAGNRCINAVYFVDKVVEAAGETYNAYFRKRSVIALA